MANSSAIAIWAVANVLHLPLLAVPFLYWQNRDRDPINVRRPRIFMIPLIALWVNIWHVLLRNLFGLSASSYLDIVISSALINPVCESFFVFALSLYIAYNKTKEQMMIYQAIQNSTDVESANKFIRSMQMFSFLLSEKFAYTWVIVQTVIWPPVVILYFYSQISVTDVLTPLSEIDENTAQAGQMALVLIYGRGLITVFWLFVLSWRLRLVQDAFGTKKLLKKIGLIGIITLCCNMLLEKRIAALSTLNLQDFCTLLLIDSAFIIAFVMPLFQTRKRARLQTVIEGNDAGGNGQKSDFEEFLLTEEGFEAFKAHLEREFSVENLLFWKDVTSFRAGCGTADGASPNTEIVGLAWKIFDKYLSSSSPLEVNLPSELSKHFRDIFKDRSGENTMITATMFDESAAQILLLMETNSLGRFLRTNHPSWQHFKALCEEKRVVHNVDTFAKIRTKRPDSEAQDDVHISIHQLTSTASK